MNRFKRVLVCMWACAVLAACQGNGSAPSLEDDLAAIRRVNDLTLQAINSGDWTKLNELLDDEYVSIINGRPVTGRNRHEAGNRRFLEQWQSQEDWVPVETLVDGDLAFQWGSFTMVLTPRQEDSEGRQMSGTYMHVYQRRTDGTWALTRAMAASAGD